MGPFLKAEGITKRYGSLTALNGVGLAMDEGASLVLLGPNGAGKSTLLGVLAGRINPTSGTVRLLGNEIKHSREARALTGYLSHDSMLYGGLSAQENLVLYCRLYGVNGIAARVEEMLRLIGLWDRRNDMVDGFSRGMEQRLAIARSLLHNPRLLILDEPFSGLDYRSSKKLTDILATLRDEKRATLLSTHDLEAAGSLGNEVAVIHKGRIRYRGEVGDNLRDLYLSLVMEEKS
ncbi:MAG: ABC transporter ATP-binding protein [Deltaproteobacteria bacterium]|nr:ABC transporter ATP-binding protein [Deltaproteobacteria bacterium]